MKRIISILIFPILLLSNELSISADFFEADEGKQISKFTGNVEITKGSDNLKALQLIVKFNENKKPVSYEAIGDVTFNILLNDKIYTGNANILLYDAKAQKYTLKSDAKLQELNSSNSIKGNIIVIDQSSGKYQVIGSDRTKARFTFEVESNTSKTSIIK